MLYDLSDDLFSRLRRNKTTCSMMEFKDCAHLCQEEDADEQLMELVRKLNNTFGNRSCECHPDATWYIAVDMLKNCAFDFHINEGENPDCGFWERLLENDVWRSIV